MLATSSSEDEDYNHSLDSNFKTQKEQIYWNKQNKFK